MKNPLYALLIAPDPQMRQAILNGTKKISIREGHRDYKVGNKVMLCCHLEPWAVMAYITEVYYMVLGEVTPETYKADGFETQSDMLQGMRRFYPDMTLDSPVTIICWDNVSGALVEEVERIKALKTHYPQNCQCQDFEHGLVANDCHVHNENPRHFVDGKNLNCDCHIWKNAKVTCDNCANHAVWARKTAFSGNHFFCETCAKKENDFDQEDSDYFYWTKL